jgi:hypothetical protein
MTQTAVEWFMEKIGEKQPNGLYVIDTLQDVQNVFNQAKAMEKEQIIDAFADSRILAITNNCSSGEQYYNETFEA